MNVALRFLPKTLGKENFPRELRVVGKQKGQDNGAEPVALINQTNSDQRPELSMIYTDELGGPFTSDDLFWLFCVNA